MCWGSDMTAPMPREELLALAQRIKLALSDERVLTGIACKHGFDLAVCAAKECENPYAIEPLLEQAEKALRGVAQTSGWQPIETALKDGTPILVDFGKHGIHRVIWDSPFDWGEGTKIWCVDDQKHGPYPLRGYSESDEAGWMPLPPPSNQGASK